MRVIGGSRRGFQLQSLPGRGTRPTADRVRESLFNILARDVPDARVLDLFAGTGALGIEALSRGAVSAHFVEQSPKAASVLRANVKHTRFEDAAYIIVGDVFRVLPRLADGGTRFNLVFIDPPYGAGVASHSVQAVAALPLLASDGLVVVEHSLEEDMPERIENLTQIRSVRYGRTVLTFYGPSETGSGQGGDE